MMEPYVFCAIFFFVGACVGSFVNAAAMRTVLEKKWWGAERSVCDSCGETLRPFELVPILSFIFLRGRCARCGAKIPKRHFFSELVCGALFCSAYLKWGISSALLFSCILIAFSLFNSLTDIENGYIYDIWALIPGATGILLRLAEGMPAALDGLFGAALGFGFIAMIIIVSRGGMGWGDAMLSAGMGGVLGLRFEAVALYSGFLIGGFVILPLLAMGKVSRKDAIPLGPFLAAGAALALLAADVILVRFSHWIGDPARWPWM